MVRRIIGFVLIILVNVPVIKSAQLYGYPTVPFNDLAYDYLDDNDDEAQSYFTVWGEGYSRTANAAYSCDGNYKMPLSYLVFGKSCFKLREAFAGSIVLSPSNPWINVTELCPSLEYTDHGILIDIEYARDVSFRSHNLRLGVRATLPVKALCLSRRYGPQDVEGESNNFDAVRCLSTEVINGPSGSGTLINSFAYRLDFLSSLMLNNQNDPLIDYAQVPLIMNGEINVTDSGDPSINLIRQINGRVPTRPFGAVEDYVAAYPFIAADGTGIGNGERGRFAHATSYVPLQTKMDNQAQLWVAPTAVADGDGYKISPNADSLRGIIQTIMNYQIDNSVVSYLNNNYINFNTQCARGLGDLETRFFAQWHWPDRLIWTEVNCSVVFPTGKKAKNPLCWLWQPLGNNGHVEIGPGIDLGGYIFDWLSLHTDANYYFVLRACEPVAASFSGACVKNVGPCIPATISWRYLNFVFDMNVLEPNYRQFGFNIGYDLYTKTRDSIIFNSTTATDFEGTIQQLDPCVLSKFTRVIAHTVHGELFFTKPFGSIFGGFSYVFKGKNAPLELSIYLGLLADF